MDMMLFLDDHFRTKSRHMSLEWVFFLRALIFHTHILNSECGAVIETAHAVNTIVAMYYPCLKNRKYKQSVVSYINILI